MMVKFHQARLSISPESVTRNGEGADRFTSLDEGLHYDGAGVVDLVKSSADLVPRRIAFAGRRRLVSPV